MYFFSYLEPVCCSMSSSNCCFLTCIQVSQEAGQVLWYSHLFPNFPQFIVIHIVKGFGIVNKTEIDVFLELSCFFDDPAGVGNLISGSSAFSKTSLNIFRRIGINNSLMGKISQWSHPIMDFCLQGDFWFSFCLFVLGSISYRLIIYSIYLFLLDSLACCASGKFSITSRLPSLLAYVHSIFLYFFASLWICYFSFLLFWVLSSVFRFLFIFLKRHLLIIFFCCSQYPFYFLWSLFSSFC